MRTIFFVQWGILIILSGLHTKRYVVKKKKAKCLQANKKTSTCLVKTENPAHSVIPFSWKPVFRQ